MLVRTLLPISLLVLACGTTLQAGPVFYALGFGGVGVFGTINLSNGAVTPIGGAFPTGTHDIGVSPSGVVYAIVNDSLLTIDKSTGATTTVGVLPLGIQSLAFRGDGALFGVTDTNLYSLNAATAAGALIGSLGTGASLDNIRFDGSGGLFVMTAESDSRLFSVNPATGAATLIGSSGADDISLGGFLGGVFIGTNAPGGSPQVVTVNPATGAATGGAATDHIYLIALDPTSVPEPATFGLFAAGALAVAVARARRRG